MDEATRARAFQPFFTTKGQNGTGLGLSTVYGIVINAGGTISVDTQPGAGCTFSIALPRIAGELAPGVRNIEIALHGSGRILVVEERTDVRDVVERALNEFGYDATAVETVDDAISVLSDTQQPLDLLLTDVVMPRMSGVELARRAIALRPKLKVLFMSRYAPDPQHRAFFANNDAGFLQKPFTPQQLTAKIAALLNS